MIALHGMDRIFLELAKIYQWKYDGGSEIGYSTYKQKAGF
jgi:hypothetical protein